MSDDDFIQDVDDYDDLDYDEEEDMGKGVRTSGVEEHEKIEVNGKRVDGEEGEAGQLEIGDERPRSRHHRHRRHGHGRPHSHRKHKHKKHRGHHGHRHRHHRGHRRNGEEEEVGETDFHGKRPSTAAPPSMPLPQPPNRPNTAGNLKEGQDHDQELDEFENMLENLRDKAREQLEKAKAIRAEELSKRSSNSQSVYEDDDDFSDIEDFIQDDDESEEETVSGLEPEDQDSPTGAGGEHKSIEDAFEEAYAEYEKKMQEKATMMKARQQKSAGPVFQRPVDTQPKPMRYKSAVEKTNTSLLDEEQTAEIVNDTERREYSRPLPFLEHHPNEALVIEDDFEGGQEPEEQNEQQQQVEEPVEVDEYDDDEFDSDSSDESVDEDEGFDSDGSKGSSSSLSSTSSSSLSSSTSSNGQNGIVDDVQQERLNLLVNLEPSDEEEGESIKMVDSDEKENEGLVVPSEQDPVLQKSPSGRNRMIRKAPLPKQPKSPGKKKKRVRKKKRPATAQSTNTVDTLQLFNLDRAIEGNTESYIQFKRILLQYLNLAVYEPSIPAGLTQDKFGVPMDAMQFDDTPMEHQINLSEEAPLQFNQFSPKKQSGNQRRPLSGRSSDGFGIKTSRPQSARSTYRSPYAATASSFARGQSSQSRGGGKSGGGRGMNWLTEQAVTEIQQTATKRRPQSAFSYRSISQRSVAKSVGSRKGMGSSGKRMGSGRSSSSESLFQRKAKEREFRCLLKIEQANLITQELDLKKHYRCLKDDLDNEMRIIAFKETDDGDEMIKSMTIDMFNREHKKLQVQIEQQRIKAFRHQTLQKPDHVEERALRKEELRSAIFETIQLTMTLSDQLGELNLKKHGMM